MFFQNPFITDLVFIAIFLPTSSAICIVIFGVIRSAFTRQQQHSILSANASDSVGNLWVVHGYLA